VRLPVVLPCGMAPADRLLFRARSMPVLVIRLASLADRSRLCSMLMVVLSLPAPGAGR
jgi:hypothetical protein